MKGFLERYKYHFLIAIVAIIGYWQVAFFRYTLKWDMLDYFLPCRYFVSESLRNGILPFWNPYQFWGYAMHADPQSGVWYPVVWVISLLHGYDVYANQFEFMLHIVLAGIGMFLLVNAFVQDKRVAFLLGCTYMMSGFFVGNAQHLSYVISGAWIPFVLFYYHKIYFNPNAKDTIRCSLSFFMLTTGGYPAFTIIVAYSLLVIFIVKVIIDYRAAGIKTKFVGFNILFFVVSVLLCSGTLYSEIMSADYIIRSHKLPLETATYGPFSPQSLISWFLPLASAKNPKLLDTDISMSNMYFGIVMLVVFILALFRKKTRVEKIFLITGLFFLLIAFGKYTPIRAALYHVVPLMNLFRFPSIFRLFALICFLVVAGFALKDFVNGVYVQWMRKTATILTGIFVMITAIYFFNARFKFYTSGYFNSFINGLNFKESILLQGLIMALLLLTFLFVLSRSRIKFSAIALLILGDLFISTQIKIPVTVVSNTKTKSLSRQLKDIPKNFPTPENLAAKNYNDSTIHIGPLYRNMNMWFKKPAYDGFNPFLMKAYFQLGDEPQVLLPLLTNNTAFFSQSYSFYSDTIRESNLVAENPHHLFFKEADRANVKEAGSYDSTAVAWFEEFNPAEIRITSEAKSPHYLTLMQHDYPLWQTSIDGKAAEHFTADYLFMSVLVPAGHHTIEYKFRDGTLQASLILGCLALISCFIFLAFGGLRGRSSNIPV